MKQNWFKSLTVLYILAGIAVAASQFDKSLRTYTCIDASAPNGEVGLYFGDKYENPDPSVCRREAFSGRVLLGSVVLIFVGPPIVLIRYLGGS